MSALSDYKEPLR